MLDSRVDEDTDLHFRHIAKMTCDNDVYSATFESKLDPVFRSDWVDKGSEARPKFKKKILLWGDSF